MVSALDSGASGPGSSPGLRHCVVFFGKTLYSHSASLRTPRCMHRELKKSTTAAATSLNKRLSEHNDSCARAL